MDTLLKILEPMIAQIEALALLAAVFLVLHFAIKHRVKAKRLKIAELKNRIKAKLSWEDADVNKLKAFGSSALDAAAITAASSGMTLLEAYLSMNPDQPIASVLDVEAAVNAGADIVSGADIAATSSDIVASSAGAGADAGAALDATAHIPLVSAVLFGVRTLRNTMRLAKRKQTGREAGINIGMDFVRIGVGGAGAVGLGKVGAAAGSAIAPGAGTLIGGGIGIFAGSLFGSQLVNNARRTLKWGKIEEAQEYFGTKFIEGGFPEFTEKYADELFNTAELRERLEVEKEKMKGYSAELDPYKDKEVTVDAVLSEESALYLETVLAKADYVKQNLRASILEVCKTLTANMKAKNAGVMEAGLAGELVLQAPQCLELTESERLKLKEYTRQKAVSKDYPCRFETTGTQVLETLSMQLFDKYNPEINRPMQVKKPVMLILFGITLAALAALIAYGLI